ncbi:MAG: PHP domain-containing protein [Lachnospiraceae bacterium]|nr:PHP domain-containing protein [Robinsoniella sp.]MDY3766543.1 PHP domain-containing protein [Lachnospiraceae bacterium]
MKYIDLHVHSNCSDGTYSPSQLVAYALEKNLAAFALTDHDTTAGLDEAMQAAAHTNLEVIPGIEFSTEYKGKDIHIVGLDIDYRSQSFQDQLCQFQHSREIRNQKMIAKLQEYHIAISWEEMENLFGEAIWTRAHFAEYLMQKGYVKTTEEAFSRFVGDHCPCYVPREKVSPAQAVRLIRESGGIPVLAHPLLYHMSEEELAILADALKKEGLIGIEAIYSTYIGYQEDDMRRFARHHGLCISGGSDFHGSIKPTIDLGCGRGNLKIPYDLLETMRAQL